MRMKFGFAVTIAAAVAMATACGKKSDNEPAAGASAVPEASAAASASVGGNAPAVPASVASVAAASAPAPASNATVVKIGHVAPVSGPLAHHGQDNENGARLAIEEISEQGLTIDGHAIHLELDTLDDAADPKKGIAAAQQLVADHVVAVVGHLNSGVSIPASKIYSDADVAQISGATTNPAFTQQGTKRRSVWCRRTRARDRCSRPTRSRRCTRGKSWSLMTPRSTAGASRTSLPRPWSQAAAALRVTK